jgi:hypothetical protein
MLAITKSPVHASTDSGIRNTADNADPPDEAGLAYLQEVEGAQHGLAGAVQQAQALQRLERAGDLQLSGLVQAVAWQAVQRAVEGAAMAVAGQS